MNREAIKKRLTKVREQKEKILKLEANLMEMEREADDAASMKIIRKERISPEKLIFFNSMSDGEIRMVMDSRGERPESDGKAAEEIKPAAGNCADGSASKDDGTHGQRGSGVNEE